MLQKCQTGKFKERANEVTGESICTMQAEFTNGGLKRRLTYVLCTMVQSEKKNSKQSHLITIFPLSAGMSERVSNAIMHAVWRM